MLIIRILTVLTLCIMTLCLIPYTMAAINYPNLQNPYNSASILINESGKYTLENNISHSVPIGVTIAASSVFLDCQGYHISPEIKGGPTVGIWISDKDKSGRPVSEIKVTNCTIDDEIVGVYGEGQDSSEFPWGRYDPKTDFILDNSSEVILTLSKISTNNCTKGIAIHEKDKSLLTNIISKYNRDGIFISTGSTSIRESSIIDNSHTGILLKNTTDCVIAGCRIESISGTGITLEGISGVRIWNNILNNPVNIQQTGSRDIVLNTEKEPGQNIIHGTITGGNFWIINGTPIYDIYKISDQDKDSIGDIPYISEIGVPDKFPLILPGSGFTSIPEPTTIPTPYPTILSTLTGIHALISGDTIPGEMEAGRTYQVTITLTNDGSEDWINSLGIGIKTIDQASVYGPKWQQIETFVPSKQTYTFTFTITAPSSPGVYEMAYQAGRAGQGVSVTFGRPYIKKVIVK